MEEQAYVSYYKNEFIPADASGISLSNRSLRYGDALFESIRVIDGKVPFLNYHLDRMRRAMEILKMKASQDFDELQLLSIINELLIKNNTNNARLRLSMIRKDGGYYVPQSDESDLLIEFIPMEGSQFILNEEGLRIDAFLDITKPSNDLSTIKSSSSLFYVLGGIFVRENDLDECLLLTEEEMVSEALHSNIFIFQNKSIYTPPLNQFCINGVMRQVVLDLATELDLSIEETPLNIAQVLAADEVMFTNAISGLKWVSNFREKTYGKEHIEEWVGYLNEKYAKVGVE